MVSMSFSVEEDGKKQRLAMAVWNLSAQNKSLRVSELDHSKTIRLQETLRG